MKIDLLAKFSVTKEMDPASSADKVQEILTGNEEIKLAFTHARDKVWFTDERIIAMDVQGITGSKKEFRSFPYSKISSFSIETAGSFDGDCDFKIWVSGVGIFEIKFSRRLDIKRISRFLAEMVL